ncbi:hypothetical protein NUW58_g2018 [Xylaria curta]|uniref:Uncharacterized protein n=1 Tax=Xylaria curta TaxID=42375 RepID=A0ACC1PJC9_9PEZI|nr:hypothetical protein NUW58_g2018 [Xylaria curta]
MGALGTLFRDTFAGQLARRVISSKALPYVEEEAGFRLPSSLEHSEKSGSGTSTPPNHGDTELDATTSEKNLDGEKNAEPGPIVDWYGPEDPENPQNWSTMKKSLVFAEICLLTFASTYSLSLTELRYIIYG